MRAATWATNRDIAAARLSWERARRFDELRELCIAAGDTASLAIGMAELVIDHAYHDRIREAAELASEVMALTESIGDPNLTVGLSVPVLYAKTETAEHSDLLRWAERIIELADGDPSKGDLLIGCPLAYTYASRAMARSADSLSYAATVALSYFGGIPNGVLRSDDSVVREIEEAQRIAERSGDDLAVANASTALGMALAHSRTDEQRDRGHKLLAGISETFVRREHNLADLAIANVYVSREKARHGDLDDAKPPMRAAVDHLFREGRLLWWGIAATGVLVETLLNRGSGT